MANLVMATNGTNVTSATGLPPLPAYTVVEQQDLISWLPDFYLAIIAPTAAYWVVSIIFHIIDTFDFFPQYRLHTPAEIAQRNKASRYEVLRDVIFQQMIQGVMGAVLGWTDPPQYVGMEEYDVAVWATRVRLAQRALPAFLSILGINAASISKNMAGSHPLLAAVLAGGQYPFVTNFAGSSGMAVPAFATWEILVAKAIYHVIIPAIQFFLSIVFLDTWQYFLHRLMHQNKWLYSVYPPQILLIDGQN